jgi:hypothetical protein
LFWGFKNWNATNALLGLSPLLGKLSPVVAPEPVTDTVVEPLVDPPLPVHVSENVLVAVSAAVTSLPLVALAPLHEPPAEQLVAPVDDQLSVAVPPLTTLEGLADKLTTGAAAVLEVDVVLEVEVSVEGEVVVAVVVDTSQAFTTPYAGSVPKNALLHSPEPLMVFCTHRVSAP